MISREHFYNLLSLYVGKRQAACNNLQNYITNDTVWVVFFYENMDVVNIFSFISVQSEAKNDTEH